MEVKMGSTGKHLVNFLAFWSIALIATVLVVGKLLGWLISADFLRLLQLFALIIAEAITAVYAYSYVRAKNKTAWLVVYIVFIVLIVIFNSIELVGIIRSFGK